jgi:hypothetical protein
MQRHASAERHALLRLVHSGGGRVGITLLLVDVAVAVGLTSSASVAVGTSWR